MDGHQRQKNLWKQKKSGEFDSEESEEEKSGLKSEEQKEEAENSEEQESGVISDSSKGSESSQETVELEKEETLNPPEQKKNGNSNKFRELIAPFSLWKFFPNIQRSKNSRNRFRSNIYRSFKNRLRAVEFVAKR